MTAGTDVTAWLRDDSDGARLVVELDDDRREASGDGRPFNVIATSATGTDVKLYVSLADLRAFQDALTDFIGHHEPAPDDPPF